MIKTIHYLTSIVLLSLTAVSRSHEGPLSIEELPKESFTRPAEEPHRKTDYIFTLNQMPYFYWPPGEFGHYGGGEYGFESLYFIITETYPCGGTALHSHDIEEAQILINGSGYC